jgi:hypothetical protein
MKIVQFVLLAIGIGSTVIAQEAEKVTLRFISFPKSASPQPVELLIGGGKTLEVKIPTNALSEPYKVPRLSTWAVGKLEPAKSADENPVFTSYGTAPALASANQLILLIRNGKENSEGMRVVPLDNNTDNDLSQSRPELVERAAKIFAEAYRVDPRWPLDRLTKEMSESRDEAWKVKTWRDKTRWAPENAIRR